MRSFKTLLIGLSRADGKAPGDRLPYSSDCSDKTSRHVGPDDSYNNAPHADFGFVGARCLQPAGSQCDQSAMSAAFDQHLPVYSRSARISSEFSEDARSVVYGPLL